MRVIKEKTHKDCKITIFSWNEKYLIKLEQGAIEQTFKVNEMDLISEDDIDELLNEHFINKAMDRFKEMHDALGEALATI